MSLATPQKLQRLQEALYAKAKQEPAFRFYCLYDKVYREDILAHAYALNRQQGGASGVDGQTFADIEAYGLQRWLAERREELRTGRYRPQPVRRVLIPKADGGQRPLGIPTIRDRVVQTAAKLVLEPIFEADFDEAAYGYRPHRSALQAVQQVHAALRAGRTEVVDADLSAYFDTIPHAELMRCVARRCCDRKLLHLVKMWLQVPVEQGDARGRRWRSGGQHRHRGTPQGGVISPLLANIYMHRYIKAFRTSGFRERYGAVVVVYADDFVVLCRHGARHVLEATRRWMTRMGLQLNESKTGLRNGWCEMFDFLGYTFGPLYSPRTGRRYLGATPSKQALSRLKAAIRTQLRPGNLASREEVVAQLNRLVRGWATYFAYGTLTRTRHTVDRYVADRVRHFLRRRHKVPGRGTQRFPQAWVFGALGVVSVQRLPRVRFANALG